MVSVLVFLRYKRLKKVHFLEFNAKRLKKAHLKKNAIKSFIKKNYVCENTCTAVGSI